MNEKEPYNFRSWHEYVERPIDEMLIRANNLAEEMKRRRTIRHFSDRDVPLEIIKTCVQIAASAPSGANLQPWHFVIVRDPDIKNRIRQAAEKEERELYAHRAPQEWLNRLAPLGTNEHKPYLQTAPYLIAIFAKRYGIAAGGEKEKYYYTNESVGIATGFLITALHLAGLASLTHTPSPMGFLQEILQRPANERAYMLIVTGFPAKQALVPEIPKKAFDSYTSIL